MNIKQTLLELRTESNLSQKALADTIGISQSTIAKIELGRNEATASTIRKLADYFNVSADYLIGRADDLGHIAVHSTSIPTLPENERQLLDLFRAMTHSQQSRFIAYGEGIVGAEAPKIKA